VKRAAGQERALAGQWRASVALAGDSKHVVGVGCARHLANEPSPGAGIAFRRENLAQCRLASRASTADAEERDARSRVAVDRDGPVAERLEPVSPTEVLHRAPGGDQARARL
jgi:hypothetical protein